MSGSAESNRRVEERVESGGADDRANLMRL